MEDDKLAKLCEKKEIRRSLLKAGSMDQQVGEKSDYSPTRTGAINNFGTGI